MYLLQNLSKLFISHKYTPHFWMTYNTHKVNMIHFHDFSILALFMNTLIRQRVAAEKHNIQLIIHTRQTVDRNI